VRPVPAAPHPMIDADFKAFFAGVTQALGLDERGYRRTRGSVRKRLSRRLRELGLESLGDYQRYLGAHPAEWTWLDACCRITISRFGRDAVVFDALLKTYLPECAAAAQALGRRSLRLWSAGCASGEEPYSLGLGWHIELAHRFPALALEVLGTDADPTVLERACRGEYSAASLSELPERFRRIGFEPRSERWRVASRYREGIHFQQADLREAVAEGPFDLICCRNLAFTYFNESVQREVARAFAGALSPGGILVVGRGEHLPEGALRLTQREPCFYARLGERA
jgi:chemotaxis protein methyltransferase CheR